MGLRTAERVVDVLAFMADQPGGEISVTEVARSMGLNVATAHHLVATLHEKGVLAQDDRTRRYRFGPKAFWLASAILGNVDLLGASRPHMLAFAARTQRSITLSVLDGDWVLGLDRISPGQITPSFSDSPRRAPVYCTALGKVLVAGMSDDRVLEILRATEMKPRTPHTICEPSAFLASLAEVRSRGVAIEHEEWQAGMVCVAVPVRDYTRQAVAALSCAGPTAQMSPAQIQRVETMLKEVSAAIATQMGYRSDEETSQPAQTAEGGA